ncbi:glycoprotein repeat domain-containing protein [uncultured Mediterranean phage]|nr:glycoprotein repeat domain-containing protein [uncultured Mediterranean phage]
MADNTVLNAGSGGDTIATDDISGVKYPLNKIVFGGTPTDVSMTDGFPVALSDTDNAVLDSIAASNTAIQTSVQLLDNAISGTEMQVKVVAEIPAGTQTIGSIKLTDGTETASVNASNQLEVAVAAALPIGNNNIGNVDVASLPSLPAGSANIGDVDVLSVVPGTGATNLGKAEDAAFADGDVGVAAMTVRKNTASALGSSDSDYQPLITDTSGRLHVKDKNSDAIRDAVQLLDDAISGNEMQVDVLSVIPGTGATKLGKAEDAVHANGDVGVMPLAVRTDDIATLAVTDGDYAPLQVDSQGKLRVTSTGSGGSATEYNEDTQHTAGDAGTMPLAVRNDVAGTLVGTDGDYAPLQVDSSGKLRVTSSGSGGSATEYNEDDATPGTIVGTTSMMERDDVLTTVVAEGDWAGLRCTSKGALWVGVDGTVALSDTDNAVLDSIAATNTDIKAAVEVLDNAISGSEMQVDVVTLPSLPTGSANIGTVALSDTDNAVLDSIDTSAAAIKTAVEVLDNAISGNEMQVDVVSLPSLPAGDANIGNVDVVSVIPGTGATNLGKAEDSVHADGDVGVMPLAVRRDANTTLVNADGDYAPLQVDEDGKLKVEVFDGGDSLTVDNGGTFVVQVDAALPAGNNNIGNVDIVTLPALVAGSANIGTVGLVAGTESIGTVALSDTDNAVLDSIDTSATAIKTAVEILDNAISGNEMQVDVLSVNPGSSNTSLGKSASNAHSTTNYGVMSLAVRHDADTTFESTTDGDYSPLQTDADGKLKVSATLAASTNNIGDVDVLSLPALPAGDNNIGNVDVASALPAGDNNIGNVDIVTLPALPAGTNNIGDVDIASALPAGTNNIGDVDIASALPAGDNNIGNVDIASALPTGNNNIGNVDIDSAAATSSNMGAALMTNVIHNGVTALTPKFAKIDAASSGDNTLVGLVSGKKIRVLSLFMISAGTVTARLESTDSDGTLLTGQMNLVVNSGFTLPFNPVGWFETAAGELLNLELSAAVSVDGCLVYVEV